MTTMQNSALFASKPSGCSLEDTTAGSEEKYFAVRAASTLWWWMDISKEHANSEEMIMIKASYNQFYNSIIKLNIISGYLQY